MAVPEFTTTEDVLAVLRLKPADRDETRITAAVLAANRRVLVVLGRAEDDIYFDDAAVMVELGLAAVTIAKNLYKREADVMKDAWSLVGSHMTTEATSALFGV